MNTPDSLLQARIHSRCGRGACERWFRELVVPHLRPWIFGFTLCASFRTAYRAVDRLGILPHRAGGLYPGSKLIEQPLRPQKPRAMSRIAVANTLPSTYASQNGVLVYRSSEFPAWELIFFL